MDRPIRPSCYGLRNAAARALSQSALLQATHVDGSDLSTWEPPTAAGYGEDSREIIVRAIEGNSSTAATP